LVSRTKRRTEAEKWLLRKIFGSKRQEVKGDKNYILWSFMIRTSFHMLRLQIKEEDVGGA